MILIPSVTEVIGFVNARALLDIPPERLAVAQDRGIDFHALAAAHGAAAGNGASGSGRAEGILVAEILLLLVVGDSRLQSCATFDFEDNVQSESDALS